MEVMNEPSGQGKTVAILSYITIIGWIIALVMHNNDKSALGAFHLRQGIGLFLTGLILSFIPVLGWIVSLGVFILWILGLIAAINGEMKPVPLVGEFYQKTFAGLN
jgi:uncharacterized membrane protein